MAVTADILRRLGKLRLEPDALEEVLAIIADIQSVDEDRKAKQRERTAKHRSMKRDGNVTVTAQQRDADVTAQAPNGPAPLPPHTPPITPTPNTHSDPVGSGSPSVEPTAPAEPMDPRRELFGRGKQTVRKLTGRPMESCGSLIGRWLKVASDDAVVVLAVIDDAVAKELANPIPWIEATIKAEAQRNGSGSHDLFNGRASGGRPSGTVNASVSTAVARHAARLGIGPGGGQDHRGPRDPADHRPRRDDPAVEDADWTPARGYYAAH